MAARAMCANTGGIAPVVKVYTSNSTYNPTAGTKWCEVEMVGAGGGVPTMVANANSIAFTSGAGSGSYIRVICLPSDISGQTVTVGAGIVGAAGGQSSIGTKIVAPGGFSAATAVYTANLAANTTVNTNFVSPPPAATSTVGSIVVAVQGQGSGINTGLFLAANGATGFCTGAPGGSTPLGLGGPAGTDYSLLGRGSTPGTGYGSGAGSCATSNGGTALGVAGQPGVVIIREYF